VIAWGGDGTVNEVGSALAFTGATLGVIPSGSGNGFARELGVPPQPAAAFAVALAGRDRMIDAGEADGRLFFNVAGFGLDARVAHAFAEGGLVRRGFAEYVRLAARELFAFTPQLQTIVADGDSLQRTALIVAVANTRQYGNGALIAPLARIDDGRLDVVIVDARPLWKIAWHVPKLFTGTLARAPGVHVRTAVEVVLSSSGPLLYHLDGEPCRSDAPVTVRVRPAALRVRVPRDA
jgi:YegS/Rv2252/BmrU family lipid kinase